MRNKQNLLNRSMGVALLGLGLISPVTAGEQEGPLQLEPVRVYADRFGETHNEGSPQASVKSREPLQQQQARSLDDVLRGMPGVTTSGGPRTTAMQPVIRGLGDERVVIRQDGARQNFRSGHRGRVFFDPEILQQVEVLRGPASTQHGSGALGGVMNLRTQRADDFLHPGETRGGRVTGGYRDQGQETLLAGTAATRGERWGLLGSIARRNSSDFADGRGDDVPNTADDILSGLLNASFQPHEQHRFELGLSGYRNDHEIPSAANTASEDNIVARNTRSDTQTLAYEWRPDAAYVRELDVVVYRTRVDLDETRLEDGRHDETALTTLGVDTTFRQGFATGAVDHLLVLGGELYRDDQSGARDGQDRPQFPDAEQTVASAFVHHRMHLGERLELTPGVRIDRFTQKAAGQPSRSESETSWQLAARYALSDRIDAYATYAEAFRAPSLTELYVGGQHFPGNFFEPNPELRPETARNFEVGATYEGRGILRDGDRLQARASAYENRLSDFIEQRVVFDAFFPVPIGRTLTENVQQARIRGQELEVAYEASAGYLKLAGSRLRGIDRDQRTPLGGMPADQLSLEAGTSALLAEWLLGGRITAVRAQDRVPEDGASTPGYTLFDLFLSWHPQHFQDAVRVDLGVDNLTDRTYRNHLSALNSPGRNLRLQATYRF
ncbi:TonB-dependent hemoglobin/transferrin/lactoferrin family receptor [Thioalkalivibrio sp. ALE9]|uniref:TonB-dependent hemoglobin/transferrin/lactoferrin family receptor n=1 Tax=Thioalkalivibrio sp. ALE9 TaxID=1158169 RepID=UPI00039DC1D1|nr:TonB-dependent hemoglobin/transferrin/lactoferrin family receptor [Thioalkalivibrio sp. ALE9]